MSFWNDLSTLSAVINLRKGMTILLNVTVVDYIHSKVCQKACFLKERCGAWESAKFKKRAFGQFSLSSNPSSEQSSLEKKVSIKEKRLCCCYKQTKKEERTCFRRPWLYIEVHHETNYLWIFLFCFYKARFLVFNQFYSPFVSIWWPTLFQFLL